MVTEWVIFISGVLLTAASWYVTRYFFSYYATQLKLGKYFCLFNKHVKTKVVQERIHLYLPYSQTATTTWNNQTSYNHHSTYHPSPKSKPFLSPTFGFVYQNSTSSPPAHVRSSLVVSRIMHNCKQTTACSHPYFQSPRDLIKPPLVLEGNMSERSEDWQVSK